jgi:hypothetical protein
MRRAAKKHDRKLTVGMVEPEAERMLSKSLCERTILIESAMMSSGRVACSNPAHALYPPNCFRLT